MSRKPARAKVKAKATKPARLVVSRAEVGRHALRTIRAKYDAAQTTGENRRHWAQADGLSPDGAASPGVRRILRNRARYEVANNGYAEGIVATLANEIIGTTPQLRMTGVSHADRTFVEGEFLTWMLLADIPQKLRTMRAARATDGEAFGIMTGNPGLDCKVQLDLRLIEAEQVCAPDLGMDPTSVDGIRFDAYGNPVDYAVLREHPGGSGFSAYGNPLIVSAASMLHMFIPKRPGQRRGVCEFASSLPLFALLRRFTLATVAAAETAADFAAMLFTENAPEGEEVDAEPFDTLEINRRMMTTLPAGWKMAQLKAEHPTTTYEPFKREIIGEIARPMSMPLNVALGDSSKSNYSSGHLDFQNWSKFKRVDRMTIVAQALERLFLAWRREAILIEGYLPQSLRTIQTSWAHTWMWDGDEHVDPLKEANAQAVRLLSGTTTLAREFANSGQDWEVELEQQAREMEKRKALGLPMPGAAPAAPVAAKPEPDDKEDPEQVAQDAADEEAQQADASAKALDFFRQGAARITGAQVAE